MSDQNTPVPDPAQPARPEQSGPAAPAPPQWRGGGGSAASPGAPSAPRRWWNEATSTGGGRAALVGVAVLGVLFLVTGLGLVTAVAVAQHRGGDERGFVFSTRDGRNMGPGMGKGNDRRNGPGANGQDKGQNKGQNKGQGNGRHQANGGGAPANPANPGSGTGRGVAGLGAVLHGEFTTNVTGTPTVMVVQTGSVTAYTAGKSLTVKSTDGYEATYTLDATTATTGRGAVQPATGVQVRVLAAKEGMKVTTLVVG
ncbi:MAG TPA: hypothetical protein VES93_03660 [Ornithinibacter sp.]|nr:hypothetical protein [Ornithinibacter sp.]